MYPALHHHQHREEQAKLRPVDGEMHLLGLVAQDKCESLADADRIARAENVNASAIGLSANHIHVRQTDHLTLRSN
jgi:hypothetical protein